MRYAHVYHFTPPPPNICLHLPNFEYLSINFEYLFIYTYLSSKLLSA